MAKKVKHYVGNVQFDIWGNMSEYGYGTQVEHLTDKNFDNGNIVMPKWDATLKAQVMAPVFYGGDELGLTFYDVPTVKNQWDSTLYIAEMKSGVERPNFVFNDTLEYHEHYYGRTSTCFYVKSQTTGQVYRVFLKDLESFIRNMDKGVITADFTFCKKGYKFGIKMV